MKEIFKNIFYTMWLTVKLILKKPTIEINTSDKTPFLGDSPKCSACLLCEVCCPEKAITIKCHMGNDEKILDSFKIDNSLCHMCGLCADICPQKCIKFKEIAKIK